ncbi:MAG: nucleotidyltransferase family protein [Deltaproteobacteria bacterium]|nr:nucleotidyltransferase family protein [Deltaproteobacteria bacterium]
MNLETVKTHRQAILEIAARHGASNVRIFGSVVRGESKGDSDVDFLVELEEGRDLFDLGAMLMDLQDLLHCRVETVTEPALHERIRENVLREAVPL